MLGIGAGSILLPPVQPSALGMPLLHGPDGAMNLLSNIQVGVASLFGSIKIFAKPSSAVLFQAWRRFNGFLYLGHKHVLLNCLFFFKITDKLSKVPRGIAFHSHFDPCCNI